MWVHYMEHTISLWLQCMLSDVSFITEAPWMGQHSFTTNATITHLSHPIPPLSLSAGMSVKDKLSDNLTEITFHTAPRSPWQDKACTADLRRTRKWRHITGATEGLQRDKWHVQWLLIVYSAPPSFFSPAVPHSCHSYQPGQEMIFTKWICCFLCRSKTHISSGNRPLTSVCSQLQGSFSELPFFFSLLHPSPVQLFSHWKLKLIVLLTEQHRRLWKWLCCREHNRWNEKFLFTGELYFPSV